jgi:hypothetical protein
MLSTPRLVGILFIYLIVGVIVQSLVLKSHGRERIPNYKLWTTAPGLIRVSGSDGGGFGSFGFVGDGGDGGGCGLGGGGGGGGFWFWW